VPRNVRQSRTLRGTQHIVQRCIFTD